MDSSGRTQQNRVGKNEGTTLWFMDLYMVKLEVTLEYIL